MSRFWLQSCRDERTILDVEAIRRFNRQSYESIEQLVDLARLPNSFPACTVKEKILEISHTPTSDLYFCDGSKVLEKKFSHFQENLNLRALTGEHNIVWGIAVRRTDLRRYPTDEAVFYQDLNLELDRFQESALFPAQAVAVLHSSRDGLWLFIQTYNYAAWVRREDIALGDKRSVFHCDCAEEFLVVTGDKVFTTYTEKDPNISDIQLDMGVRLPLIGGPYNDVADVGENYTVELPTRDCNGYLIYKAAKISTHDDVRIGFLPYTRSNLVRQAFKFLGEPYGWGHGNNARDCTGYVSEIYKSFGIHLPRNSKQQGESSIGTNIRFNGVNSLQEKLRCMNVCEPGDLIYLPDHVMLYLGQVQDEHYAIHDISGFSCLNHCGQVQRKIFGGVSVTRLLSRRLSLEGQAEQPRFADQIYNIKKIV